jgi:dethiobiotin synthetase
MSTQKIFFIAGTDTDVGKTFASCSILSAARAKGYSTAAIKPVAAGVSKCDEGIQNEDVVALSEYCSIALTYEQINPVCFADPIAPHIAAAQSGISLDASSIAKECGEVLSRNADLTLVEGAGGWKVPLSETETMADIARKLDIPVILIVGMRLGCLNHALLSAQSILADGLRLAGWIANQIDADMPVYQENISTLVNMMPAPMLAEIPRIEGKDSVSQVIGLIDVERILSA